ncbi:MAG: tripartite tricarboxylate transporter substrate binding protein BugD [Alphaproteobacteria bacterium]|nr:tripartite tricarboxylate transporter substrate binding protein BugD [Alphaproteobacteria bacterium]
MGRLAAALAFALFAVVVPATAQTFPSKPITMIVPFPAGGGSDILARIVAERMKASLGQPVIIENVGGAGGTIGTGRVARAAPDGYTVGFGQWSSHVGSGALYPLQFDLLRDLTPVARLTEARLWIIGRPDLPAKNLRELIAWLKANPGKATGGTVGAGSGVQLCFIDFQNSTGTKFNLVPYRGAAPIMQDLLAGQIDLSCPEAGQTLSLYRAGKIRAFAVMGQKRWFAAPEVPTTEEAGAPGLHMTFWYGLWAPAGVPKDIIARLNAAVVDTFADPAVRARLTEQGHEIPSRDQLKPEALGKHHKSEIDKWWPIIKAAGIKL